jgi:hypothetical protein
MGNALMNRLKTKAEKNMAEELNDILVDGGLEKRIRSELDHSLESLFLNALGLSRRWDEWEFVEEYKLKDGARDRKTQIATKIEALAEAQVKALVEREEFASCFDFDKLPAKQKAEVRRAFMQAFIDRLERQMREIAHRAADRVLEKIETGMVEELVKKASP